MEHDRETALRGLFAAFMQKDRKYAEGLLADDFHFTSPYDDRIDKATFFVRCWPNSDHIESQEVERVLVNGDKAVVLYQARLKDGHEFRNAEFFRFDGDKVSEEVVFFGATYKSGRFQPASR